MKFSSFFTRQLAGIAHLLLVGLAACGLAQPAWAGDGVYVVTSDVPVLGTVTTGDLSATQEADGVALKLAEAKDASGNYGLEWSWVITGIVPAEGFRLQVVAQATNSKQGMDHYEFEVSPDGAAWTSLGVADQTTMASYAWPVEDFAGDMLFVRVSDTNRDNDPRRANQLWLDQLVLVGQDAAGGGGGGGDPGGGSGGGDPPSGGTGPATDRIIAGYYPSWAIYSAREYWVRYIPFERVTHVYYAFANLDASSHEVVIGDTFAELTNRKDPETSNGLPAGNLNQLVYFRDVGFGGSPQSHLKLIISVGGWSWSANFSEAAASPESRYRFASSLAEFVNTYKLDGADIDWEFPTGDTANCGLEGNGCEPDDPVNHALLLMAARLMLGPDKELSIAMPANAVSASSILPPLVSNDLLEDMIIMANCDPACVVDASSPTAAEMLDYIHIMNYDQVGASWEATTRHHAPLYGYEGPGGDPADDANEPGGLANLNGHYAVQAYRHPRLNYQGFNPDAPAGVWEIPSGKLTLGIPMYGRGFGSVDAGSYDGYPGLFQYTDSSTRRRVPKGTWDGGKWGNSGVFAYWDLLLRHGGNVFGVGGPQDGAGVDRFYGNYLLEGDLFVGFDDPDSVAEKVRYVVDQNLGGVMFWDFPGDVSEAQVAAGVPGAATALETASLVDRIATELEQRAPTP